MRAYERHGFTWSQIALARNERRWADADGIREFVETQAWLRHERRYVARSRNRELRTLIGPIPFDGPIYRPGETFVGEIVGGRIMNGVTLLHYWCIRGMHDTCFNEYVDRMRNALRLMRSCQGPRLP